MGEVNKTVSPFIHLAFIFSFSSINLVFEEVIHLHGSTIKEL